MDVMTKAEVKNVIDGTVTGDERIPLLYDLWIYPDQFEDQPDKLKKLLSAVPKDVKDFFVTLPSFAGAIPSYRPPENRKAYDSVVIIKDWEGEGEELFDNFPEFDSKTLAAEGPFDDSRYLLGRWWYCYFERLWSLRGMENALMDFYLYPDEVHTLFRKLTDLYCSVLEGVKKQTGADGIFVSDDIGTQTGPFFSLDIFREFFKPYYKELIEKAHSLDMHFWLHSCGNIELFMEDFIEIGLDVIHPIQKRTMDEAVIAERYGDRICILAGFEVQEIIPFGTPEEVRKEVQRLISVYKNPSGRFMLTMGNGTTPDWKYDSIEALYEESLKEVNAQKLQYKL